MFKKKYNSFGKNSFWQQHISKKWGQVQQKAVKVGGANKQLEVITLFGNRLWGTECHIKCHVLRVKS